MAEEALLYLLDNLTRNSTKSLCIIILGNMGTGKSSLINSLFGEQLVNDGSAPEMCGRRRISTESIIRILMVDDIRVTLWVPAGLINPSLDPEEVIKEIRDEYSVRGVDLFVYCTRFDQTKLSQDDIDCIQHITTAFGDRIWKRALFALTCANQANVPQSSKIHSLQEDFQSHRGWWKENLHRVIKKSVDPQSVEISIGQVNSIPIVTTGDRDVPLPDGENWLVDFWEACFSRVKYTAIPALFLVADNQVAWSAAEHTVLARVVGHRLAEIGDRITQPEIRTQKSLDEHYDQAAISTAISTQFASDETHTYTWDHFKRSILSVAGFTNHAATMSTSTKHVQDPAIIGVASARQGTSYLHAYPYIFQMFRDVGMACP